MVKQKSFWIGLSLINLCVVATFGLLMRSKAIFPLPFLDYKNILNAHSHVAFSGWVALVLFTYFIYDVLPGVASGKKKYQVILWGVELSSISMALSFPFLGYNYITIIISTAYIFITYIFAWHFTRDVLKTAIPPLIKWLGIGAVSSLALSSIGPYGLAYIIISKSANSLLYRDFLYTFLHFQYNGFFTLSVFALFFYYWFKKENQLPEAARKFSYLLVASILPSLFLSLLWHQYIFFYVIAATGCLLIFGCLFYFLPVFRRSWQKSFLDQPLARLFWIAAFFSFFLKMLLTVGTIFPALRDAVYGARPVIIGFLHLVFLGFVSFYLLALFLGDGFFRIRQKNISLPFIVFGTGVVLNELFLLVQGMGILFKTNSSIYYWCLWGAAIILFSGAILLASNFYKVLHKKKPQLLLRHH